MKAMSSPVSIQGVLEKKASGVPFLFALCSVVCRLHEQASRISYTFELISNFSYGRVASLCCFKMDRSTATKVPAPSSQILFATERQQARSCGALQWCSPEPL